MKKSLIALAALASFAGAASAQSSVTLFGVVDTDITRGTGSIASVTRLSNSGISSSQLGFRGTEDLGGGLSASFWLEAGHNSDDGSGQGTNTNNQASGASAAGVGQGLTFNRRSTLSLNGGWGEVRLGRDYTPQFRNLTVFDPFGTNGVGTNVMLSSITGGLMNIRTAVRASNSIAYLYNTSGFAGGPGFYGTFQYYMGENASNTGAIEDDGRGWGGRIGFASGPFNVALGSGRTKYSTGNARQTNIGGSWDFGMATLMAQYSRESLGALDGRGYLLGGLVPVGPGMIRIAYSRYRTDAVGSPSSKKWALGYVHNLSKRTALYATYAHVGNSGGAAQALNGATTGAGASSNGYDFGIRHAF
jgi:predicted porin